MSETTVPREPNLEVVRPYQIHLVWISGQKMTIDTRTHAETDYVVTIIPNDRRRREMTIPFTNLLFYEVDKS